MPDSQIDHLGIAVRSLDRALEFYAGQLGFAVGVARNCRRGESACRDAAGGRPPDRTAGAVRAGFRDREVHRETRRRLHHVALKVPDLAAAVERLKAGGARLLNEPRAGAGGHQYVFVHPASTGGVLLELIQA